MEKNRSITYEDFLEGYKKGSLRILVDTSRAGDFVLSEFADKHNKPAHLFWSWTGIVLTIPVPVITFFLWGFIPAISWFIFGLIVISAARKSAVQFVSENMLKNKMFLVYVLIHKGAIIQDESGNTCSVL